MILELTFEEVVYFSSEFDFKEWLTSKMVEFPSLFFLQIVLKISSYVSISSILSSGIGASLLFRGQWLYLCSTYLTFESEGTGLSLTWMLLTNPHSSSFLNFDFGAHLIIYRWIVWGLDKWGLSCWGLGYWVWEIWGWVNSENYSDVDTSSFWSWVLGNSFSGNCDTVCRGPEDWCLRNRSSGTGFRVMFSGFSLAFSFMLLFIPAAIFLTLSREILVKPIGLPFSVTLVSSKYF